MAPLGIKEGVISDPMLLYSICYLVYFGVTRKKSARNLKVWPRFQVFKISQNSHNIDKQKIDITRLILKIQDSNFTCKPNVHSRKKSYSGIKVEGPLFHTQIWYHGSWAIAKLLRGGGPLRPPPMVRVRMKQSLYSWATNQNNKNKTTLPCSN